jgi:hypothetical protein
VSIYIISKIFRGQALDRTPFERQGREGKGREGKGREGKGSEGAERENRGGKERGWEGRVRERSIAQIKFHDYSTGDIHGYYSLMACDLTARGPLS